VHVQDVMADKGQVQRNIQSLNRMVQFCENQLECRRVLLLEYFGEVFDKQKCARAQPRAR
jgi:superfamily II DNA helicase RecQ